ncbi:MAG: DUF2062 domain-containing protein [Akkermansiaceae bacterium]|jgi:uncharacterized protein (DUF2062 family)
MGYHFKIRYLRLVRKAYRTLRSPGLRRHGWLQKIIVPMFHRELWHPCRDTVASGLAIGLFFSQLPIPGQMLLAALGAVRFRANVPFALAACWVTNPFTQLPIMLFQERFGDFLQDTLHIPIHPILEKIQISLHFIPGMENEVLNGGSFILGFLTLAFILMLLAYPIVYLLSAMMPKMLPKTRYQRAKAKVIARNQKNLAQNKGK